MNSLLRRCAARLLCLLSCAASVAAEAPRADLAPLQPGLDYHSFANIEQFRVTHLELNLMADFRNTVLLGSVTLEIKRLDARATELVLDTRDLDIRDVEERANDVLGATAKEQTTWVSRPFHLDKSDPILGSPLIIELPPSKKTKQLIRIEYVTSPGAPALQWLSEKQTVSQHHPFLYTVSEPIAARSWIPLQDTPQVRATYSAHIHTPRDVIAVMSAKNDPKAKRNGEYAFDMPDAVPSYMIALAIGDLRFEQIGERTGVYAERQRLSPSVREFADAEAILKAGEKLGGSHPFERYDILVLPPSYPVGGMANPRLTFVSPTIVAGERSLSPAIARELAHCWSGDRAINATWRDLWLNEAIFEYQRSRILAELYGERRDAMDRVLGLASLREALARLDPQDQALAIDLRGRDPRLAFSVVPYEKGRLFLTYLEAKFGRERLDAFLKDYLEHFDSKSVTTEQFLAYLKSNLLDRYPGLVSTSQVAQWVSAPGIPADAVLPSAEAFVPIDAARSDWLSGKTPAKKLATRDWAVQQWLYFLDHMPTALRKEQLADLDQAFGFTQTNNAEVGRSWLLLVIRNAYQPGFPRLGQYVQNIGRTDLIAPLYAQLMKTPAGATTARRLYALARPGYHPDTVWAIDAIVNPEAGHDDE